MTNVIKCMCKTEMCCRMQYSRAKEMAGALDKKILRLETKRCCM